jgi:hypothetical protein
MSARFYTPEELAGKYIVCYPVSLGVLECVRYSSGPRSDLPYLYNSIEDAQTDQFFDPDFDEVVEAQEYYNRINSIKKSKF